MRVLLVLLVSLGACVCPPGLAPEASAPASAQVQTLPDAVRASAVVIGDGDGSVVIVSMTAGQAIGIDPDRPARLRLGGGWVEAAVSEAPSARRDGDQMRTTASYRVKPQAAGVLARGGDVLMQLSVGGVWHEVTARRADVLE